MFSITCDSCTARLKVQNASAIGQVLSCPKCGSMIKVVAPENWNSDKPELLEQDAVGRARSAGSSLESQDFEDIENLIREQETNKTKNKPPQRKSVAASTPRQQQPVSPKSKPSTQQGVRPRANEPVVAPSTSDIDTIVRHPQNWVNPETKKRQQILLFSVLGLVSFVLLFSVGYMVVSTVLKSKPDPLAVKTPANPENETEVKAIEPAEADVSPEISTNDNNTAADTTNVEATKVDQQTPDFAANDSTPEVTEIPLTDVPQPLPGVIPPPLPFQNSDALPTQAPSQTPSLPLAQSPLATVDTHVAPSVSVPIQKYENVMKDLSPLLDSASTSFDELSEITKQGGGRIGLSRLFVEKEFDYVLPNVDAVLSTAIPRIQYVESRLDRILTELSELENVPIGFSIAAASSVAFDLSRNVSLDTQGKSLREVLSEIVAGDDLVVGKTDWGILLDFADDQQILTARYPLPKINEPTPEKMERFIEAIKANIDKLSWALAEFKIGIVENEIEVTHLRGVHRQVAALIENINQANAISRGAATSDLYVPLFLRADERMTNTIELKSGLPMTLDGFAARVLDASGLQIVVDWAALSEQGWTRGVTIPGYEKWSSATDAIRDVCEAMNLEFEVLSERTILLTTSQAIARRVNVEVYPIGDILSPTIKPENVLGLIDQTVGAQLTDLQAATSVRLFEAECQGLILIAPQSVQRKSSLVLDRLRPNK